MSMAADRRLVRSKYPTATLRTVGYYPWMGAIYSSRKSTSELLSFARESPERAWHDAAKRIKEQS